MENGITESEPFNKDNYSIPATPLRAKIALSVFKQVTDFFSSNSLSKELDYSDDLKWFADLTRIDGDCRGYRYYNDVMELNKKEMIKSMEKE